MTIWWHRKTDRQTLQDSILVIMKPGLICVHSPPLLQFLSSWWQIQREAEWQHCVGSMSNKLIPWAHSVLLYMYLSKESWSSYILLSSYLLYFLREKIIFIKNAKKSEFVTGELYFFELLMFSEIYFLLHLHIDRLINLEHYLHIIDIIVSTALIFCIFVC